jgi:hypothetical protein
MPSPYELRTRWFEDCKEKTILCSRCGRVLVEVKAAHLQSLKLVCDACRAFNRRDRKDLAQDKG